MPIYAYRCAACGHAEDLLMKVGASAPKTCPACGAEAFTKQVTAAGFQLKGSGWYVTDFRGGTAGADKKEKTDGTGNDGKGDGDSKPAAADKPVQAEKTSAKAESKPATESKAGAASSGTPAKPTSGADKA